MTEDSSGLAQLNAVLQARGYISRPLDFGDLGPEEEDEQEEEEQDQEEQKQQQLTASEPPGQGPGPGATHSGDPKEEHAPPSADTGNRDHDNQDQNGNKAETDNDKPHGGGLVPESERRAKNRHHQTQKAKGTKRKPSTRARIGVFADIITLILADSARDLEAKTALSARVRQLESSLARQTKTLNMQADEVIMARKQASSAQAQVESITTTLTQEKAAHKTTSEELTKVKREVGSVRLLSSQAKHAAERRAEGLRSKLSDVTIQTLLSKGCTADLRVVGGSFGLPGTPTTSSATPSSANVSTTSITMSQINALEQDRSALVSELTAIKLFATECVNSLRSAGLALAKQIQNEHLRSSGGFPATGNGTSNGRPKVSAGSAPKTSSPSDTPELLSRTTSEPAFVGDLFPALLRYSRTDQAQDHPASKALAQATEELDHQASQLTLLSKVRAELEDEARYRAKLLDASTEPTSCTQDKIPAKEGTVHGSSQAEKALSQSLAAMQRELTRLEKKCKHQEGELARCQERAAQAGALLHMYQQQEQHSSAGSKLKATHSTSSDNGRLDQYKSQVKAHPALENDPGSIIPSRHISHHPRRDQPITNARSEGAEEGGNVQHTTKELPARRSCSSGNTENTDPDTTPTAPPPLSKNASKPNEPRAALDQSKPAPQQDGRSTTPSLDGTVIDFGSEASRSSTATDMYSGVGTAADAGHDKQETYWAGASKGKKRKAGDHDDLEALMGENQPKNAARLPSTSHFGNRLRGGKGPSENPVEARHQFGAGKRKPEELDAPHSYEDARLRDTKGADPPMESTPMPKRTKLSSREGMRRQASNREAGLGLGRPIGPSSALSGGSKRHLEKR